MFYKTADYTDFSYKYGSATIIWQTVIICKICEICGRKINNMKLNDIYSGNYNPAEWEAKGYLLPKFDIAKVREKTAKEPTWVHFGGGNIFRAFPAAILNDALNTGKYDRGVIVAETFDF